MKTYKFTLSLILILAISISAFSREEVKREYHDKYATNEMTNFHISNKYGEVTIQNTMQDEITIDVVVKVESSSLKKSQAIIDDIYIKIAKNANTISAVTDIESNHKWNNVNVNIDYTITMPSYVNTKLDLRYGDATIADIVGAFDGEVRYGNFRANNLSPRDGRTNSLRMAYCGQVNVKLFGKMNLDLSYSDAKIDVGDALNLDCKYSDVDLGNVAILKADLGYSDLSVRSTLDASIDGRYSDTEFGMINSSLVVDTKYGDVDVDRLGDNFELLKVDAAYGDVEVTVSPEAQYKIDLSASYGDISFPRINVTDADKEGTRKFIRGYVEDANSSNMLMIETSYGDINVRGL